MKRKMMKFLSLFLSVSMAINVFTVPVFAAPEDEGAAAEQSEIIEDDAVENVENGTEQENVSDGTEADADAVPAEETPAEVTAAEEIPAEEATTEEAPKRETISVEESYKAFTVNVNDIDFEVDADAVILLGAGEETAEVDTSNPVISVVEEELNDIRVLNDEGESVALTEEQIQTVLYLYDQYQKQWVDNANVLGVQMPFFLQYNDNGEDGLGILGEMLVLAGYTVDQVRNGGYKYDDLVGMIQNFYYADQLGVEIYGDDIAAARDEALAKVKDSGATTLVQKMLVINDWLAHKATFDMSYIMNMGKDEPIMVAESPQKHESYDKVYNTMYAVYEEQITNQFRSQIGDGIKDAVYNNALEQAQAAHDDIYAQVYQGLLDNGMEDNEETAAIAEEQTQTQIEQIAQNAVDDVVNNGMPLTDDDGNPVLDENEEQVRVPFETVIDNQMDQPLDDLGGMTPNEAIPVYADQAAQGLTSGILGAWEGNHIGILSGYNTGVCCGYAKAFAYLVQCMMPEIYGISGESTDMRVSSNWKTAEELYYDEKGNLDITRNYAVDLVRITFNTQVSMYGEPAEDFNSDHFWNAVQVDGTWYYIDPCYIDVYTEVMSRDRVEVDGNMNHMYFMFSHDTALEMYGDYMLEDGIKSLYADVATDESYEDSWFARISSNAYSDGSYFYYLYDSSDMFGLMREMDNSSDADYEKFLEMTNSEYKLVRHAISDNDIVTDGADSDYDTLIEFNHKVNEDDDDDDTTVARVKVNGEMVENELLTELFAQFEEECDIYPSITISTALYNGKLYFNLSNCILSYDLSSGEVVKVKEYNTVYGARDNTKAFGGMAFSVVDSASGATHTVENHPIASMTIKDDGKMYVSIATNFAYISGKDPHDLADSETNGYGYEFEESNYNPNYSTYFDMDEISEEYGDIDSDSQDNDNDEFMWSAVFVDTLNMSHLEGGSHSYRAVTVEPFCGRDGFTENRCTECGAIEADSRVVDEGSACDHHYIHFVEEYYTKDDNDNWNTGDCYVCTICGSAVSEPVEPTKNDQESQEDFEERQAEYEVEKAEYDAIVESAGHVYTSSSDDSVKWNKDEESGSIVSATIAADTHMVCDPCEGKELDVLQGESTSVDLDEEVTLNDIDKKATGKCEEGLTVTYTATGTTEAGTKLSASKTEKTEAGEHAYEAEFTWTPISGTDKSESGEAGTETPDTGLEVDNPEVEAASEENDDTAASEDEPVAPEEAEEIPYKVTAVFTCAACGEKIEEGIDVDVIVDDENSVAATCSEPGKTVYVATAIAKDAEGNVIASGTDTKEEEVAVLSHYYQGAFTWTEATDEDGNGTGEYTATATITCTNGGEVIGKNVEAVVAADAENEKNKEATCTETGVKVLKATATVTVGEGETAQEVTVEDTKEVTVPALGHDYSKTWDWSEDYSTAELTLTCSRDESHTVTATAEVTSVSEGASCDKPGKVTYTATVVLEGETYTDTKETEVEALGHDLKGEFTWEEVKNDEGKTTYEVKATSVKVSCNRCDIELTADEPTTVRDDDNSTAATCTEDGVNTFKATAVVKDKDGNEIGTVTGKKEVTIPASGHAYTSTFTWEDAEDKNAEVPYTATVTVKCVRGCGVEYQNVPATVVKDEEKSKVATCTEDGVNVYTATATVRDENGNEIITVTSDPKEDVIPALGHALKGKFDWEKNPKTHEATATSVKVTCTRDCGTEFVVDEPTTVKDEAQSKAATRKEEGVNVFVATAVVKDQDGNEVGTVTDSKKMLIPALGNPFEDVAEDAYYYDAVLWAYDNGITQGKDDTHFAPNNICNRAQVVTFLWRAMGEPEPESTVNPFVDVAEDAYYYKAVLWAYYKGVTTGKDETHFQPNATVTRSQVVTFMYRNEGEPAVKTTENPFVDVTEDKYYYNAVLWAYENDITTGKDDTHFLPGDECKRCQVVTFLYRAYGDEK